MTLPIEQACGPSTTALRRCCAQPARRHASFVAGALCLLAAHAQAGLISNGSFEAPLVPMGGYTTFAAGAPDLVGWSVLGIEATVSEGSFTQSGITFQAQDGNQWLDLSGESSNSSLNGVQQDVATTPGVAYLVSFYVGSAFDGVYFFPSSIDLAIDGSARWKYTNPAIPTTSHDWMRFDVGFVATGTSTRIAFYNGSAGDNFTSALDNVSVTAVPEPATGALLLAGLGALVGARRVRRHPEPGSASPEALGTKG